MSDRLIALTCERCGALASIHDLYCETCGQRIAPNLVQATAATVCTGCGAPPELIDHAGFCTRCGTERLRPDRDHWRLVLSDSVAGLTDRGLIHSRNEDYFRVSRWGDLAILVVCDGVSSSQRPDEAAETAANAITEYILQSPQPPGANVDLLRAAILAGDEAVRQLEHDPHAPDDPPETTVVAAILDKKRAAIGWLGDSRAYFLTEQRSQRLTADHSFLQEYIETGQCSEEEALTFPYAHAVTRVIGAPGEDMPDEPTTKEVELSGTGWLLLCSDGLWNYVPEATDIAGLIDQHGSAEKICETLVNFAIESGGRDNIAVTVARV